MKLSLRALNSAGVLNALADLVHKADTLSQLVHGTPAESYKGKPCSVVFVNMNKSGGRFHVTYRAIGSQDYSDPNGHIVKMRFYPDSAITNALDLQVEVSCNCYAFVYYGAQHRVDQKESLERDIKGRDGLVNKSAPDLANYPQHTYLICKHIYAVSQHVQDRLLKHLTKYKEDSEFSEKQFQKGKERVEQRKTPNPATPTPQAVTTYSTATPAPEPEQGV